MGMRLRAHRATLERRQAFQQRTLPCAGLARMVRSRRMPLDLDVIPATAANYASRSPQDILSLAFSEYSPEIGISFSGAEDVVLIDILARVRKDVRIVTP